MVDAINMESVGDMHSVIDRLSAFVWLTCALVGPGAFVHAESSQDGRAKPGCDHRLISMLVSPDDAWTALVDEATCSDGAYQTVITDTVQIVRDSEQPTKENDVFSVDEGGHPENRPLIQWLSTEKLRSLFRIDHLSD
jgi:hypothetical protein